MVMTDCKRLMKNVLAGAGFLHRDYKCRALQEEFSVVQVTCPWPSQGERVSSGTSDYSAKQATTSYLVYAGIRF